MEGKSSSRGILREAKYGQVNLATVSQQLTGQYGQGGGYLALAGMMKALFVVFAGREIVSTVSRQFDQVFVKMGRLTKEIRFNLEEVGYGG